MTIFPFFKIAFTSKKEYLRLIDAYTHVQKHGEVCPANWEEGKEAIAPNAKGTAAYLAAN